MKKVLIIDDYEPFRAMTAEALRTVPYDVQEAGDGSNGLRLARLVHPDVVIIDIQMEGLSGYDTLRQLRADPGTANIPVILMTGNADLAGLRRGMALGADDYLPKPFHLEELFAAVQGRLAKTEGVRMEAEKTLTRLRQQIGMMLPHEMLTPLTGILGIADIIGDSPTGLTQDELKEFATSIQRSARRLQHLVQNFLIYAQIELMSGDLARQQGMRGVSCENAGLVIEKQAKNQARLVGRESDLCLALGPATLPMSRQYLEKVSEELISNAFKFSRPGTKVVVQLVREPRESWFTVKDEGYGMKPEFLQNIGAYMQFDRKIYEQQGSGLGLVISKRLIELHGGSFDLTSEPGVGTTAVVRFPAG